MISKENCNHEHVVKAGIHIKVGVAQQREHCKDCGAWLLGDIIERVNT